MRARLTWNLDDYLEELVKAGEDVDEVTTELLSENSDYFGGLLYHYLWATSEQWTGATAKTLFVDPVRRDGNYIYVELGAKTGIDPSAWYKEYGTPRQAAEPFLRPTMVFLRRKELRRLMERLLEKMGTSK